MQEGNSVTIQGSTISEESTEVKMQQTGNRARIKAAGTFFLVNGEILSAEQVKELPRGTTVTPMTPEFVSTLLANQQRKNEEVLDTLQDLYDVYHQVRDEINQEGEERTARLVNIFLRSLSPDEPDEVAFYRRLIQEMEQV